MTKTNAKATELRLPAIEIQQGPRRLYAFSVDGKLISQFATVSRVKRTEGDLEGYQRPEQLAHIEQIQNYIESPDPLLPNAIVIAFDSSVRFVPAKVGPATEYSRTGELVIALDPSVPAHLRPGFIVDGQQRVAAIRDAEVESFPLCATGFIAQNIREQTEQFILVNSTKPLPKGLIHELLPETDAMLPLQLERRRLPAMLVTRLKTKREHRRSTGRSKLRRTPKDESRTTPFFVSSRTAFPKGSSTSTEIPKVTTMTSMG